MFRIHYVNDVHNIKVVNQINIIYNHLFINCLLILVRMKGNEVICKLALLKKQYFV